MFGSFIFFCIPLSGLFLIIKGVTSFMSHNISERKVAFLSIIFGIGMFFVPTFLFIFNFSC
jgi:hypothetical protein